MSPRAACRLETLGFRQVYDYVGGKADWLAHGLPVEGERSDELTAGKLAGEDVVTARLDEPVGALRERVQRSPYGFALVLGAGGVVLGRLRKTVLERDPHSSAQNVMEPGPSTVRPDTSATALAQRLRDRGLKSAVVTTPEGKLIGVLRLTDVEELEGD